MYEIGNEFSYVIPSVDMDFRDLFKDFRNVQFVRCGREGFGFIADDICLETKEKPEALTVFLPALSDPETIKPFELRGCKICFYPLLKDLTIDIEALEDKIKGVTYPVVVTKNLFGCTDHKEANIKLKQAAPGCVIIDDITHILYTPSAYNSPDSDYCVGSIRKWTPLPDGAVVTKKKGPFLAEPIQDETPTQFSSLREGALLMKTSYLKTGDAKTREVYTKKLEQAEASLDDGKTVHCMSRSAEQILSQSRVARVGDRRNENYHTLYALLHELCLELGREDKKLAHLYRLLPETPDKIVPFMMPVVFKSKRDKIAEELEKRGIYTKVIWTADPRGVKAWPAARDLSEHTLAFWIDQRYDRFDMEQTRDMLREALLRVFAEK